MKATDIVWLTAGMAVILFINKSILDYTRWHDVTESPTEYTKVIGSWQGKEKPTMHTGRWWVEYRKDDGIVMAYTTPDKWRYTIF